MSKNFELLQQIGNEEELFQAACQSVNAISSKNGDSNPELDKEAREKILQNASLPNVLRPANVALSTATPAVCSEPNADLKEEVGSTDCQSAVAAREFRNSRNPSTPIGESVNGAENRVTQSNAKGSFSKTLGGDKKPKATLSRTRRESLPEVENFRKTSPPLPWLDGIRMGVSRWAGRLQARQNQHGIDVEALAREQEIKLVQRIFPGARRIALFAGVEEHAGCPSICARAGEILAARAEGPVCVVDANFQSPSLHRYFGVENEIGLVEATRESGPIQNFAQQIREPDLWLLPSGRAAARLSFASMADGLRVRITELRETFRYVVIHSGPLRRETGATLLSRWTDGVVLVLEANSTRRDSARRAKDHLATLGVSVLGVVLNNRTFPIPEAIFRRL
jgi:Mrp family chromosome partitioning ATPase